MQYKALSVLQPWASLYVHGNKILETRSWNTQHRGPLLIHASKSASVLRDSSPEFTIAQTAHSEYHCRYITKDQLAFGAIIGMVNIVDTVQFSGNVEEQLKAYRGCDNPWIPYRTEGNDFESLQEEEEWEANIERELAFGDFSAGRYGWLASEPIVFHDPIPAKGMLGLWTPDDATSKLVTAAIATAREGLRS